MPTIDGPTTTLASLGAWAQPFFDALKPYAYFEGGIILAVGVILLLIGGAVLAYKAMKHSHH